MTEVNKENMRAWVTALRSGEFKQAQGKLVEFDIDGNKVGHCCLGVAAEVAVKAGVDHNYQWELDGTLPEATKKWLGLPEANPTISNETFVDEDVRCPDPECCAPQPMIASLANDSAGWDFARIADAVESYYGLLEDADASA